MSGASDFIHLHVHSEFSLLDGACRIRDIIKKAGNLGMDAVAVTDHGNMYAAIRFYFEAKAAGIHPIIGCEAYLAPRTRFDKETKEDRSPYHITLIAKDLIGYHNLLSLVTLSNTEGFYSKPRIDKDLLAKYGKGLVVLSGCLGGEIPSLILSGNRDEAEKTASDMKDMFGGDFYLEVMDNDLPEQRPVNNVLFEISKKLAIPCVATNDCHYIDKDDSPAQDTLLCIGTGRFVDEESRMRFGSSEFYMKSGEEMAALFTDMPEAISNTREIREKCGFKIETGKLHFPDFPVPKGETSFSFLRDLAGEGIKKRYGSSPRKEVTDRLEYELSVIDKMGYAPFFLVVQDFINYAKDKGIEVGPGRGSAAGSIVSYAVGITEVDPLKYNLIFERFLNIERVTMPDIDTDFCFQRRQEVIDYVIKKYGEDHVAQIITFGTIKARASIRDVGRVQRMPLSDVDRIAKLIPDSVDATIDKALSSVKEFKDLYESDTATKDLIDTARTLEGLTRHASVHAAGVVISQRPLVEYVPLQLMNETQMVTQYSMKDLEKIGLLKMDFLGLRNLTMIAEAVKLIEKKTGARPDIKNIPFDDQQTFDLLSKGETMGIFQLESRGMRALIKELKPDRFEDIIALNALYRPGPLESGMAKDFTDRKKGLTKTKYELAELEPILKETYGVILYQEQVMEIASSIAGFTMGEADVLRYAMGKKNTREMAKQREKFIKGTLEKGFSQKKAKELFDLCEHFSGYGFNKSHSTAYSIISYQTAYLKAHYPKEFMAALLTSVIGDTDKITSYIVECLRMGISVLPPDINESGRDFSVSEKGVRFALAAVKNIGFNAIDAIVAQRAESGSFVSFEKFCERMDQRAVNKKVIESLIKCGAFDSTGEDRGVLLSRYEKVLSRVNKVSSVHHKRQTNLFGESVNLSAVQEEPEAENAAVFSKEQILRMEKEMLGVYLSGHPMQGVSEQMELLSNTKISDIAHEKEGANVRVGGVFSGVRKVTTRKKETMAVARFEDLTGSIQVVIFPRTYERYSSMIVEDVPVILKGRADFKNDELQVICEEIEILDRVKTKRGMHIEIPQRLLQEDISRLKTVFAVFPGAEATFLHIGGKVISASENYRISISPALIDQVEKITGKGSTWITFHET
ncbi:MAG: DNA polymerase III subunit alpha [Candidatus Saganbacteria bacterium]|nr:DNA polymerase III subunit alpha [Candidatus Saganbacteria bacterium]